MADTTAALDPRRTLALIGLGAAIGLPASGIAILFIAAVHQAEHWLWHTLPHDLGHDAPPWYLLLGLPLVGAVLVWLARTALPGDGGHGALGGLKAGATPYRYAPSIALAAFGSLAFGAVLGPEAPLIGLGSAVGVLAAKLAKVHGQGEQVLAAGGSFAAVSPIFGGPLVAGMVLLEAGVGMGAAIVPVLIPGVVAAATGYLLFVGLGNWGGIQSAGLTVGGLPQYSGTHLVDLFAAILIGGLAGLLIVGIHHIAGRVAEKLKPARLLLPGLLAGGLLIGLLALIAKGLGTDPLEILFSGQADVGRLTTQSIGVVLVVLVAKSAGYLVSLCTGFRGGAVFPAILLSVGLATVLVIWWGLSPTWAIAVGTAAGTAASSGLLFSAMLFSLLLVGHAGLDAMPAAVFAAVAAWLVRRALTPATTMAE